MRFFVIHIAQTALGHVRVSQQPVGGSRFTLKYVPTLGPVRAQEVAHRLTERPLCQELSHDSRRVTCSACHRA